MKYNRTLQTKEFVELLKPNGKLRWLFDFVKQHRELDFLTGNVKGKEWISVYRGLSKILQINATSEKIVADTKFQTLAPNLFSKTINDNFQNELVALINEIPKSENDKLHRYYENKKEGFYQNKLSRKYGINSEADSEFVIIDKEVVVSYDTKKEKENLLLPIQEKFQQLQKVIAEKDTKHFGTKEKKFGNELDFLALDKDGNVLLIEYKHGTNTSGIYWSSLQVGVYYEIFNALDKKEFEKSIFEMLKQKQEIGLINPNWKTPREIKEIIPVVMISEFDENKGVAKKQFDEVLNLAINSKKNLDFLKSLQLYKYNNGTLVRI